MTPLTVLQRAGPFLLPTQPLLTLSHTQRSFPAPFPSPTAKENSLTDPSPEALLLGQAKSEPYCGGRGGGAKQPLPFCVAPTLGP